MQNEQTEEKAYKVMHWCNMGSFHGYVMLSAGFSYKEVVTLLKKKKATDWLAGISEDQELIDQSKGLGLRRTVQDESDGREITLFYIFLSDPFDFTDESYCILAHEIVHILQFYLPGVLDRNREIEAEAYLHTHLMRQCLEAFRGSARIKKVP